MGLTKVQECIRELILPVCRAYPEVSRVYLFGSMARGDFRVDSDVDLWVHVDDEICERRFGLSGLVRELEGAIPRDSDIVTVTDPRRLGLLYSEIERDKVRLYERPCD